MSASKPKKKRSSTTDLQRLRHRVACSRAPRTAWDYVVVETETGRTISTHERKWDAILVREELLLSNQSAHVLCIGYERVYRLAFPKGPLRPQFILVEKHS